MLDETEFLSDYGVRALSRQHLEQPFSLDVHGEAFTVQYQPAESTSGLFGGNSNWRGPIWMPVNYLLIESLQRFHHYYGDDFKVECPTGSGKYLTLLEIADELSRRLCRLFLRDEHGRRAVLATASCSRTIRTSATTYRSTNTFTATVGAASRVSPDWLDGSGRQAAPAARPFGQQLVK